MSFFPWGSDDEPFDPRCGRSAAEMEELDSAWPESPEEYDETPANQRHVRRVEFVLQEEGTLNPANGHFLCNRCYIEAGMPVAPGGWVCP